MAVMSRLRSLVRNLVRRRRVDRDLDDEVRTCFEMLEEEQIQRGMTPRDARRQATLRLGRVDAVTEQVRSVRAGASLEILLQDLRYGVRALRRTPGFTGVVVVTLALGIGVNTAVFTLLDAVILKPLPLPSPNQLVTLYENGPEGPADATGGTGRFHRFSYPRFERLERAVSAYGPLAAVTRTGRFVVRIAGQPSPVSGQLVSGGYFTTLGVSAARGRVLMPADMRPDQTMLPVVIGDGFWKRSFGAAPDAIGRPLVVNGVSATVVGIAPPTFVGTWTDGEAEIWMPVTAQQAVRYLTNSSAYSSADRDRSWLGQDQIAWLNLIGRFPRARLAEARGVLEGANRQGVADLAMLIADEPSRADMLRHTLAVVPFARGFSGLRARFTDTLVVLTALVGAVLLVTCLNVANLMLARGAGRARDVRIRISLGATRGRLIRHSLIESLLLALLGGAAGWLLAHWISAFLARQVLASSRALPQVFAPDSRVLVFAMLVSLGTALVFGLAPALRVTRLNRGSAIGPSEREEIGDSRMRGMRPLVAGQLALSVGVVFVALLLSRTLINYSRLDPGFASEHVVSATFGAADSGYSRDEIPAFADRLVAAAQSMPGVRSAAVSNCGLIVNCTYTSSFRFDGSALPASFRQNWVTPGYFATMGIPLLAGRDFDRRDTAGSARVAIVTESIARRVFASQSPIGRRLGYEQPDTEIVGVVRDVRSTTVREGPTPMIYFPITQPPAFRPFPSNLDVLVEGDAAQFALPLRDTLRRAEPALILDSLAPMSQRFSRDLARERLVAYLASAFGLLALLLASLGLYGVLSYMVARRTREIGVRMALGAQWIEVIRLVVRQAFTVVAAGALAGVALAIAAGQLLSAVLFGVSLRDPATYALAGAILVVVSAAAAYAPARRASLIDPVQALRNE